MHPADLLFASVLLVYLLVLLILFAYGANFAYLTWLALRSRTRQPKSGVPSTWPIVTIQLPIYNELYVAERLIDQVARMDYPADRLEIQVLDDSTDETTAIVSGLVGRWRALGVDIQHVRRPGRVGFKAGALAYGLDRARGELIAIFDADFLPRPDFLRRTVPVLLAASDLAFVQARWGHLNRNFSLLTRLQALAIDGHFGVEQAARSGSGLWFNFNGTAGIWRRSALLDAGGWQHDTLTEDLDISYRAFLAGWRAEYLVDLEVPAELPVSYNAFRRQQHRWARGSFECVIKLLPAVWHSGAPLSRKVSATLHLTGYSIHLLLLALSLLYPLLLVMSGPRPDVFALFGIVGLFNLTTFTPTLLFAAGQRQVGRRWTAELPAILLLSVFGAGMMMNTARAAWQAVRGRPASFERTPKFGLNGRRDDWLGLRYQLGIDRIVIVELVLATLNATTVIAALERGSWAIALYAGIFAAGLAWAVALTVGQSLRTNLAARRAPAPIVGEEAS
jgi:cellulose synthase/poly-beta-1,6-N-acetylglucosamine synthase-like glycosyltransferase